MKNGTWAKITVEGRTFEARLIGKGTFAFAFHNEKEGRVYLFVEGCNMKDALACFARPIPHVPDVTRYNSEGNAINGRATEREVYSMPYYRPLRASFKEAWAQFRELQRANEEARAEALSGRDWQNRPKRLANEGHVANALTIEKAQVPAELTAALEEINSAISNYGAGCTFEFAQRNLAVDSDGRLVLLDIAFDSEAQGGVLGRAPTARRQPISELAGCRPSPLGRLQRGKERTMNPLEYLTGRRALWGSLPTQETRRARPVGKPTRTPKTDKKRKDRRAMANASRRRNRS